MKISTVKQGDSTYPKRLMQLADPPQRLYAVGDVSLLKSQNTLGIVGSRKVSTYGKHTTIALSKDVAVQGIVTVSGLALGVDGLAHGATIEGGGKTVAVLPCGLDRIYPSSHRDLAERIIKGGGLLISEYPPGTEPFKSHFIARNRIVAALGDGLLITEAASKSGSLHTANFALELGRPVMAVPGNITSLLSEGTNNLLKVGATPVTDLRDILSALGLSTAAKRELPLGDTDNERIIIALLAGGITDASELLFKSSLDASSFNQALTMLEINGHVSPLGAGHWGLS